MIKVSSFFLVCLLLLSASALCVISNNRHHLVVTVSAATPAPSTTAAPVAVTVQCDRTTACYPWSGQGPSCASGSRMNLRFTGTMAPENGVNVSGIPGNVTDMTYAFCPKVDELQAFNLTNFTRLTGVYSPDNGATWELGSQATAYLAAIGFGNQTLRTLPPLSSDGKVMVMDATTNGPCSISAASSTSTTVGTIAFASFLVLNVSLLNGNFVYLSGYENPPGNGFAYTCNENDICTLDTTQKCIGEKRGRKMCGKCFTPATLAKETMQVWVSYYGTDVNGRTLRSGASNPLNFLAYSLVNVLTSVTNAYDNIKNAQLTRPDLQSGSGP